MKSTKVVTYYGDTKRKQSPKNVSDLKKDSKRNMRNNILGLLSLFCLFGCSAQRKIVKILEVHKGSELSWYSQDAMTWDSSSTFKLYSSEYLFDSLELDPCPKIKTKFSYGRLIDVTKEYYCEGDEPPKGNKVRTCYYPYSVKKMFGKRCVLIPTKLGTEVFYIDEVKRMPDRPYIVNYDDVVSIGRKQYVIKLSKIFPVGLNSEGILLK